MALSILQALEIIDTKLSALSHEIIPIEQSLGRIVAREYSATFNLPRFDNSAMDGYAVKISDQGKIIFSNKEIFAGDNSSYRLLEGEAIRIMTGAPVPDGCEAIVPIEDIIYKNNSIILPAKIEKNKHIRRAGEDIKKGAIFIKRGERVSAYTLALLASQGITHITVIRKVRVAIFGTGSELRPHYEKIEHHQLYNSNAPMFLARAKELGCEVTSIETSSDSVDSLQASIVQAAGVDIIITSGGVSVGDRDFTIEAFRELGMEILFSGIDIKPGKPTTLGKLGKSFVVNLPGNPLAAMVNFEMFIKIMIFKLSGSSGCYHGVIECKMDRNYSIKGGKYTVILGSWDGKHFKPIQKQSPGMVNPLKSADALMVTSPQREHFAQDETVYIIPVKTYLSSQTSQKIFN